MSKLQDSLPDDNNDDETIPRTTRKAQLTVKNVVLCSWRGSEVRLFCLQKKGFESLLKREESEKKTDELKSTLNS